MRTGRISNMGSFCMVLGLLIHSPAMALGGSLLYDDFTGEEVSSSRWYIPTWTSPDDGTFVGRTQFRCTPAALPAADEGNAVIVVETYNPTGNPPGQSFYGTDLISKDGFSLGVGAGIHITVRAKMNPSPAGIVGGIFLYALKPGSTTLHDEIDFELLTKRPNEVQTNLYANQELGRGDPVFVNLSGSITDYHTYEIRWLPTQVSWFVDGQLVRTETDHVPTGPMQFHLNIWVPDKEWAEAYDEDLKYAPSPDMNQTFSMSVDSVSIQSMSPVTPILPLLLLDEAP